MVPLFISLGSRLQLMVIQPDGITLPEPAIPTNIYRIFRDMALKDPRQSRIKEAALQSEHLADPDYFGYLSQQNPDKHITYFPCGKKEISYDEVDQLIEQIKA